MRILQALGGVAFWAFLLWGLYLKTVLVGSGGKPVAVRRNRFLLMAFLWILAPGLGAALLAVLVFGEGASGWVPYAAIAAAVAVPWVVAMRLQLKWARDEKGSPGG